MTRAQEHKALDAARLDVERYGFKIESMVFAEFFGEDGKRQIRPFQWARRESRIEFDKLVGWASRNDKSIYVTPFATFIKQFKAHSNAN